MTQSEAKQLLLYHSFAGAEHPFGRTEPGFLGALRPFTGALDERNYREVVAALRTLGPTFAGQQSVDREVVSSLWAICHLTRAWALHPDSALRRDGRITAAQVETLDAWIDAISYATMVLLEGNDDGTAFEFIDEAAA